MMNDKVSLRRSLLHLRKSLSPQAWREKSDRLCGHLQESDRFQRAKTVLAYISIRNEPDLSPLFKQDGYRWGFPRCVGTQMEWHHWVEGDRPLQPGAFGILEPHPEAPKLSPDEVDLILVPAVACDRQGHRLGYGGGFYDRMFSDTAWKKVPTIGIVFEESLVDALPIETWDHPLQSVCTDAQLLKIESG